MKRQSFDERRDQRIANDYHDGHMACSWCNTMTPKAELAELGARCRPCFDDYCRGGRPTISLTPQQRSTMGARVKAAMAGGKRLAGAEHIAMLQRRADAGEGLSPGVRGFLAAVRRASGIVDEPAPAAVVEALPKAAAQQPADDLPPWALDDIPASAYAEFPAANAEAEA